MVDIYCRVSTLEQAQEGYSLQEQEQRLRSYADAQGWTVHAVYVDPGCSGANLDRPGIKSVIADAESHKIDRVLTYKLDRLSRSQKDTLHLIEDVFLSNGVAYTSMTESLDTATPFGMAMIGVLSVFAQLEREQIKERMMLGRVAAAKEGRWRGGSGVPIGYRYIPMTNSEDGRLVVDPYEAEQVKLVFSLFLQGRTYHNIYEYMRGRYSTSYGKFGGGGAGIIPKILSNRAYIGEIKYQGIWYKGKHEPIIDADTFQRAQDRLAEYTATLDQQRRMPYKSGHLLTGLLFCGECGGRWCWHSCTYKNKAGEKRSYNTYTCYTKNSHKGMRKADKCSIPVWPAEDLESVVWEQIASLRFEDDAEQEPCEDTEASAYESRISAIDAQLVRLVDLYAIGSLPMEAVQKRSEALQAEKAHLQEAIDARRRGSGKLSAAEACSMVSALDDIRKHGTMDEQRQVLQALISKITLEHDRGVIIDWNF